VFDYSRVVSPTFYTLFRHVHEKCVIYMWYLVTNIFGAESEYYMLNLVEKYFYIHELLVGVFSPSDIRRKNVLKQRTPTVMFRLINICSDLFKLHAFLLSTALYTYVTVTI
jgi:hypothetical protein